MPKKNKRGRRRVNDVVNYDFVASFGSAGKKVTPADLGIVRNRSMRPLRVVANAVMCGASQSPAMYLSLYDTKDDIISVSRSVVVGNFSTRTSVSAPRGTDFGDYAADDSNVFQINLANYYNGTITVSGTIWMQFVSHKITSKVALLGPFTSPDDPRSIEF